MAANSKHPGDILIWLEKVLNSCITMDQVDNTRKLFAKFEEIYKTNFKNSYLNNSICELYGKAAILRNDIFNKTMDLKFKNELI